MSGSDYDQVLVDIITYVYHTPIESPLAYRRARIALLDALGCAIETLSHSADARAFIGPVVQGTYVPHGFRLPGTQYALDPLKGAFDLGSLIRYLDHNDAYPGAEWGHPSDNLGAIIAIADWKSRTRAAAVDATVAPVTLKTVLTAQIKAYEIQGVLQMKNAFNQRGFDHTILVKIASTAVVSKLIGLSEESALSALSHAWQDGHPLRTFRQAPNVGPRKGWAAGDACARAVHLCLLAKNGQPGAPSVLTTPKWGLYDVMLGEKELVVPRPYGTFVIEYHFFKLIAAEGHAISAVEAALDIAARLKDAGRSIKESKTVTIRTQGPAKSIIDKTGPLRNPADRDHCIQYIVAVTLLKGSVIEGDDYADESCWAKDPRVDELRRKIVVVEDEQFTKDYYDQKVRSGANAISITMEDGTEIPEVVVEFPVGHPKHLETLHLVVEKFKKNMEKGGFGCETVNKILDMVEENDRPVHEFIDLFAKEVKLMN